MTAPSWLVDVPLAHRGLHGDGVPENSIPAFAAAAEAGYGVELDVRITRDRVPIIAHDAVLTRVTGTRARVGELAYTELRSLRLAGSDERVPTLPEALAATGTAVPVMVEVKSLRLGAGRIEPIVAEVLDEFRGRWCAASFNPASLRWFRRHRHDVVRVLTSGPLDDVRLPSIVRRRLASLQDVDSVVPDAVCYDLAGLPSPATDGWRASGRPLLAWNISSVGELERARDLADNVVFEGVRP